jgi:hypothetical protein
MSIRASVTVMARRSSVSTRSTGPAAGLSYNRRDSYIREQPLKQVATPSHLIVHTSTYTPSVYILGSRHAHTYESGTNYQHLACFFPTLLGSPTEKLPATDLVSRLMCIWKRVSAETLCPARLAAYASSGPPSPLSTASEQRRPLRLGCGLTPTCPMWNMLVSAWIFNSGICTGICQECRNV